ncbi:methionyl-tRNA formyltransferase [Roseobacter sp. HKCCD5988]|uniref:methionyl-tRNA formyltransferase n=1 Tax=Roseobacter sp. HKCCD5988 TaxID=3120338 RepID=UPI0030ED30E8
MNAVAVPVFFIGCVQSSEVALRALMARPEISVKGVLCMRKNTYNSDFVDLSEMAAENCIPIFYAEHMNQTELAEILRASAAEITFAVGWSRLLDPDIISIPRYGTIGFHPSALPQNRGRHPLIWALALGLEKTASTFFMMEKGADTGPIINQKEIDININDNAQSLYQKVLEIVPKQINMIIDDLIAGQLNGSPQDHSLSNYWRKRSTPDGRLDWRMSASAVYNLTRALTRPYTGAEFYYGNHLVKVWRCELVTDKVPFNAEPGKVLSVDVSGPVIKTGLGREGGAVRLSETDPFLNLRTGDYL